MLEIIAAAVIGTVTGAALSRLLASREDELRALESLQREKEVIFREASSLRQELDRLVREKEEIVRKYEEELQRKSRQLQVQLSENSRLMEQLSLLQLEKKSLENTVATLESRLRSSIPREVIRSLTGAEKLLQQMKEYLRTGKVNNYRLVSSDEHDKLFARVFASERKVFLTSPFITEDAVKKRLPEIEAFLEREDSTLFLVIGREWNTVRFGDEGLLLLARTLSKANGRVKLFADNVHHKVLAGENSVTITSYNFLSKNNRLREVGVEIDDSELARKLVNLEIENLKNSSTARRVIYERFRVVKVESSTSGKTYRVETSLEELPRVYFPLEIEPKEGTTYEAVLIQKINGDTYTQVIAAAAD
ncbi:hypothetical protein Theam_1750 (plasmid) [Thermovibrio ammonificans HB-1]|uniref:Uncharacterized protein n=1 Tax=Thermovibrio ammonificans (strain DSM 15698 / JCM 12110 / HB-1) TaxID=648996 RepID=E8T6Y5_THEA1|nr:hypothetical protein [Thermovibrio ammonificans]ADU97706.1 hypothetical protein Theam_1750 [Thermovibrio ammonificans HB-1]